MRLVGQQFRYQGFSHLKFQSTSLLLYLAFRAEQQLSTSHEKPQPIAKMPTRQVSDYAGC